MSKQNDLVDLAGWRFQSEMFIRSKEQMATLNETIDRISLDPSHFKGNPSSLSDTFNDSSLSVQ